MSRIYGAKDLRTRSHRSDIGKKRKHYAGKPTKRRRKINGNFVPYRSKRGRNDPISIWFQHIKRMSYVGYMKWNPKSRMYLDTNVKVFIDKPVKVNPLDISTPEKIGDMAIHILKFPGTFNMLMPSASRNSFRVSYKKKAIIRITESEDGLHAKVSHYSKMKHYWFFRG